MLSLRKVLIVGITLLGGLSINAMEQSNIDFPVIIKNNLVGAVYSLPIIVTYTKGGKKAPPKVIQAKAEHEFRTGELAGIGDEGFKIDGYGAIMSTLASEGTISKEKLINQWQTLKQNDTDILEINVIDTGILGMSQIDFEFKAQPMKVRERIPSGTSPLMVFPEITARGLHKQIKPRDLFRTPLKEEVWWGTWLIQEGMLTPATTAEDVSRYILRLPKEYTKEDVEGATNELLDRWDPKDHQENPGFAKDVRALIILANRHLNQALKDKR